MVYLWRAFHVIPRNFMERKIGSINTKTVRTISIGHANETNDTHTKYGGRND